MEEVSGIERLEKQSDGFPAGYRPVITESLQFISCRLEAADVFLSEAEAALSGGDDVDIALHAFLRECWDTLDGLGRLVNCILYEKFGDAGLYDPLELTRQCTFYNVRRALCRDTDAIAHPVVSFIERHTLSDPAPGYERLSYLYNLSLFAVIPLSSACELPCYEDLPMHLRRQVRRQRAARIDMPAGMREIRDWLAGFVDRVCGLLAPDPDIS